MSEQNTKTAEQAAQPAEKKTRQPMSKKKKTTILAVAGLAIVGIGVGIASMTVSQRTMAQTPILEGLNFMCAPCGITEAEGGGFLVTDVYGKKIWYSADGRSSVYAGADSVQDLYGQPLGGYNDAPLATTLFREPWDIEPFLDGYAVSDAANGAVRLLRGGNTQTVNGSSDTLEMSDLGVTFSCPTGLTSDPDGNLYVADTDRGMIIRIDESGTAEAVVSGLNRPMGIDWKNGALYIAETGANRIVKAAGGSVEVVAGSGEDGDADGSALSAGFSGPQGVTVGDDGTVYVGDTVNGSVRKIKDGQVTTILSPQNRVLTTHPVSPGNLVLSDGHLYVCDPFSRMIYALLP